MKSGIIGLPQVGKSSLFKILTKAHLDERTNPREAHLGVAKVPDERLDKLSALYSPKKTVHASIEYVDVAAVGEEALKEAAYANTLRNVDSLIHVVRAFENPAVAHVGEIDPLRDIKNVDFDLMVSDLGQIEKRMERLERDLKRMKSLDLEREADVLKRAKAQLESERPLREMAISAAEEKLIRGFMFLSQKPILYVLNISESTDLGKDLEAAVEKFNLKEVAA
nr:50S ribosome-binding GTPase [Acidobacteriota bacterium]